MAANSKTGAGGRTRVLIAGLGDTGTLIAVRLGRRFEVTGVSTKPLLVSGQELGNRLTRPGHWRRNFMIPFSAVKKLDNVETVHGRIRRLDTVAREAFVETVSGGETRIGYEVLVIASGVTNGFWRRGELQSAADIDATMSGVSARIDEARTVAIVGGGATGASVAANLAETYPAKDVHLFFSRALPLPGYHDKTRRRIVRDLEKVGVTLHAGHRAELPGGAGPEALTSEPVEWSTGQPAFEADAVLWAVGRVKPNSDYLPADMLDDGGFVRVDDYLQVPGYEGVFAVGDIAASDPNRSSARNWGYFLVAHNVRAFVNGRRMRRYKAPEHRWGSILGVRDDGMTVFQPNGSNSRMPKWVVDRIIFPGFVKRLLYRGIRRFE